MGNGKSKAYKVIALMGLILWSIAIILRGQDYHFSGLAKFLIGTMPNFGSAISIPFIIMLYAPRIYKNKKINETKLFYISITVLFIAISASEIIHDVFLNSQFDKNDIIMSILAIALDIIFFQVIKHFTDAIK